MTHRISEITDTLADRLDREPGSFDPVTALRVAQTSANGLLDIVAPVGVSPAPLGVSGYERRGPRQKIRALFANLTGPVGALPHAYNELVLREERNRARALSAFFDLFNSRVSELFADASDKYRLARRLRWRGASEHGGFIKALLSLAGLGTHELVDRVGIEQDLLLRFSGYFSDKTRHASGLRAMLGDLTGLPIEIEQFRPRWLAIPLDEQTRMGQSSAVRLGINTSAGSAVRDLVGSFRIVVGPVRYGDYLRFSPDGRFIREVVALTRLYVGPVLDFDIQVILHKDDVPFSSLSQAGHVPRLGWNSWARIAPAERDSRDAIVNAHSVERRISEDATCRSN
ncbi:type VI secretion system baseplate subunit TssG [Rhizobium sp. AAP43]|uniref:type VI secretion system baseplate subunit TssG n=1 Tax=Rhizobium sp. AAP43 TaxID=1523420 RepID=UPI0006B9D5F7|nr:type VI secretion system baseplate subunit TssG [Rhizobium sp. AAP43]KPF45776.1 type VI secretion protein [Rhizobium sp. AAP43]